MELDLACCWRATPRETIRSMVRTRGGRNLGWILDLDLALVDLDLDLDGICIWIRIHIHIYRHIQIPVHILMHIYMCWIHEASHFLYRAATRLMQGTRAATRPMQGTRAATRLMKSTQANSKLSSIAASHSGYGELHSIAVDQQACQLTGSARRPTAS